MSSNAVASQVRTVEGSGLGTMSEPSRMQIVDIRSLSDRVMHFTLAREDGGAILFEPGQFCNVAIPGADGELWRSYSIATPVVSGKPSQTCDITVAAVPGGAATEYLFTRRTGEVLRVSGPFGRLVLPSEELPHYVLVGTGTGMAPYRAMLPELERRARETPCASLCSWAFVHATSGSMVKSSRRSPDARISGVSSSATAETNPGRSDLSNIAATSRTHFGSFH